MSQATSPRISILGDGTSTFEGYTPTVGSVYSSRYLNYSGFGTADGTWWMQVIDKLGGSLAGNNSFVGSYISYAGHYPAVLNGRLRDLAKDGVSPDMILVYTGINDAANDIPLDKFKRDCLEMLNKLKTFYPEAEVWCGTICTGEDPIASRPRFIPLEQLQNLEPYNEIIRECVKETGCHLVDLAAQGVTYSSTDGIHPDKEGMVTFANAWLKNLQGE